MRRFDVDPKVMADWAQHNIDECEKSIAFWKSRPNQLNKKQLLQLAIYEESLQAMKDRLLYWKGLVVS